MSEADPPAAERLASAAATIGAPDGRGRRRAVLVAEGPIRNMADGPVSYTHLRAHETVLDLVCRLLLEKKNNTHTKSVYC